MMLAGSNMASACLTQAAKRATFAKLAATNNSIFRMANTNQRLYMSLVRQSQMRAMQPIASPAMRRFSDSAVVSQAEEDGG